MMLSEEQKQSLEPWLAKLRSSIGSVVVLAIENEGGPIRIGWLNAKERTAVKLAIEKVNRARVKRDDQPTTEEPLRPHGRATLGTEP